MSKTKAEIAGHVYDLGKLEYFLRGGLVNGAGSGERGDVCVEQAVALCAGVPLTCEKTPTDSPSCISDTVREFGVSINDEGGWKDNADRASGLRRFAFAQLGTRDIPGREFDRRVIRKARAAGLLVNESREDNDLPVSAEDAVNYLKGDSASLRKLANIAADVCCAMRKAEGIKVKPVAP